MSSSPSDPEVREPSAVALDLASDLMECSKLADSARQIQDALDAAHEAGWRKGVEEAAKRFDRLAEEQLHSAYDWEHRKHPARTSARMCEKEAADLQAHAQAIRALRDRGPA